MPDITDQKAQAEQRVRLRQRARTDKFFLSQLLGYIFQPDVHTELFAQYIPFDNNKTLFEQSVCKDRLTLWSRGFYKTHSVYVEAVQLILNFPDVSIMLMQSTMKNTKGLLKEIKGHFDGSNPNSKLDTLFPEFCRPKLGTAMEFSVPCRTRSRKDPTVFVASPKSIKAGLHPDVGFFDDLVNEVNYKNPELMKQVIEDFGHFVPLINPGGYRYVTGTRYTFGDLYEHIIRANNEEERVKGKGRWQITIKDCWNVGPNGEKTSRFPIRTLDDGRTIGLSVEMLEAIRADIGDETFSAQYLNQPISGKDQLFPESLLMSRVVTDKDPAFPALGPAILAVDLASSVTDSADHTVILAGRADSLGRIYVTDICAGKFTPATSAPMLIAMALKHRPAKILVEHTSAAAFFIEHLNVLARDKGVSLPLVPIKVAIAKGAKYMRIAALESRFKSSGLFFLAGLPHWERLVEEFAQFPKGRHDDFPDTVGILVQHFSAFVPQRPQRSPSIFDAMRQESALNSNLVRAVSTLQSHIETLGSNFS